jgi:hypothetical protein
MFKKYTYKKSKLKHRFDEENKTVGMRHLGIIAHLMTAGFQKCGSLTHSKHSFHPESEAEKKS